LSGGSGRGGGTSFFGIGPMNIRGGFFPAESETLRMRGAGCTLVGGGTSPGITVGSLLATMSGGGLLGVAGGTTEAIDSGFVN
jgi:hypothetical protein